MKAISIKQPWASLIVEGVKDIENRTWPTKFRGRVLIHASAKSVNLGIYYDAPFTRTQWAAMNIDERINSKCKGNSLKFLPKSVIIGSVEIVDCVINHDSIWAEPAYKTIEDARFGSDAKPIYNWVLANPIKFPEPIPAKGKLSFWDYPNILAGSEENNGELFCHCQLPVKEISQVTGDSRFGYYCRYCGGRWYK